MIVGTAGHVDHGKSTLVRLLTGTDPDRWEEERRRGLTIDLGFASLALPSGRQASFVDVPGHARFVKNMLAGTGGFDLVVLCVAADEGWMPQTEEHAQILDLLGVHHGVVVLTKCDTVDVDIVEERELEIEVALAGTSLEHLPVVRTSAGDPASLERLRGAIDDAADRAGAEEVAAPTPRPRLWIDRVFTVRGAGTVVTGTLTGGPLAVGHEVSAGGVAGRIRGVHVHDEAVTRVGAGTRTALNLNLGHDPPPRRGDAVTTTAPQWESGPRLQVWLRPVRGRRRPPPSRGAYHLHVGTRDLPARLALGAAAGGGHFARLYLPLPVGPVAIGDRFVLRDESDTSTTGGGVLLAVTGRNLSPDELGRRLAAATAPPHERAAAVAADLLACAGGVVPAAEMGRAVGDPAPAGTVRLGELLFAPEHLAALREGLAATGPEGTPVPTDPASTAVAAELARSGVVEVRDGRLWPPGAVVARAIESETAGAVAAACKAAGTRLLTPPEAAAAAGAPARVVERMLEDGRLLRIGEFVTTPAVRRGMEATVRAVLARGPATASALREALGTTRKWALPVLEALDRAGVSRREGELRVLMGERPPAAGGSLP